MPYAGENEKCGEILSIHILQNCMKPECPEGSRDEVTNGSFFITHTIVWNTRPWRNMHIDIRYSFLIIYSINNEKVNKKINHYFAIYKISNLSIRILFLIFYLIKNKLYLHLLIMIVSIQNVTSHWIARNFFKTTECIIC